MKDHKDVDEYIADAPEWARGVLADLRRVIKSAAPDAKESISYHMPYYSQNGRLAYFGWHANHCSFHWIDKEDKDWIAKELDGQKIVGQTLQIPRGEEVPTKVIQKLVKARTQKSKS